MAFAVIVVQNLCFLLRRHSTIVLHHRFQNPKLPTYPSSLYVPGTLILQPRNLASSSCSSDKTLAFTRDELFGTSVTGGDSRPEEDVGTIAAIVTSVGGPSAAVGIVRLSGSLAVEVASRVFRPARKLMEGDCFWRPRSHFVEYGFALDKQDNVIDEAAMIVMSARFWANVELAVGIFTPFVKILRRVDGDTPSMGWLYGDIKKAREEVAAVLDHQENKYLPIWKLIDSRWEKKMSSPLHLAGYYLNPHFYYSRRVEIEADGRFMSGFVECLSRIYKKDPSTQDHISADLDLYQYQQGLFGRDMAKRQLQNPNLNPVHWWRLNGADTPHLKTMAMKILSLTTSSSACERNWSTFEMIHSKKRNKLDSKRLNDLVFVKFNALLKSKYSDTSRDPLAAKNVDSGKVQEWMVNVDPEEDENEDDDDEVFPGEGLTWAQIGNIVDADHDERRPPRLAISKEISVSYQRRGKRRLSELEEENLQGSSDEDHILATMPTTDESVSDEE